MKLGPGRVAVGAVVRRPGAVPSEQEQSVFSVPKGMIWNVEPCDSQDAGVRAERGAWI